MWIPRSRFGQKLQNTHFGGKFWVLAPRIHWFFVQKVTFFAKNDQKTAKKAIFGIFGQIWGFCSKRAKWQNGRFSGFGDILPKVPIIAGANFGFLQKWRFWRKMTKRGDFDEKWPFWHFGAKKGVIFGIFLFTFLHKVYTQFWTKSCGYSHTSETCTKPGEKKVFQKIKMVTKIDVFFDTFWTTRSFLPWGTSGIPHSYGACCEKTWKWSILRYTEMSKMTVLALFDKSWKVRTKMSQKVKKCRAMGLKSRSSWHPFLAILGLILGCFWGVPKSAIFWPKSDIFGSRGRAKFGKFGGILGPSAGLAPKNDPIIGKNKQNGTQNLGFFEPKISVLEQNLTKKVENFGFFAKNHKIWRKMWKSDKNGVFCEKWGFLQKGPIFPVIKMANFRIFHFFGVFAKVRKSEKNAKNGQFWLKNPIFGVLDEVPIIGKNKQNGGPKISGFEKGQNLVKNAQKVVQNRKNDQISHFLHFFDEIWHFLGSEIIFCFCQKWKKWFRSWGKKAPFWSQIPKIPKLAQKCQKVAFLAPKRCAYEWNWSFWRSGR